jgi:uncharacterized protein (TIGR00369 family)
MRSGKWLLGPDAVPSGAALGVLLDDMLGNAIFPHCPAGLWPVTTEISVDYLAPPPCDGQPILARSRPVSVRPEMALASGVVEDASGTTLAVATLRSQSVPAVASSVSSNGRLSADHDSLMSMLGASVTSHDEGVTLRLPPEPAFANPRGGLHGGITLCASHLAGAQALATGSTASIRVAYLRPIDISAPVDFVARIVHGGRAFGVAQVTTYGAAGKPCALATVTCYRPSVPA